MPAHILLPQDPSTPEKMPRAIDKVFHSLPVNVLGVCIVMGGVGEIIEVFRC
jgi:hypothetical protein